MPDFMKEAREVQEEVVRWRRHIHANPETGLHLPETTAYVMEELRKLGYEPQEICDSGITAVLEGGKPGKCIMLRADMDALPIPEDSGEPFSSKREGVSHACGHDAHTAMLLGAAKILKKYQPELCGRIKFLFQPGEETGKGALTVLGAGVLENPHVDTCMAFHQTVGRHDNPTGQIGFTSGMAMASADIFRITVTGKSSHGAKPDAGVNPIMILVNIYNQLQAIETLEIPREEPLALTIGQLEAGKAGNAIPDTGIMCGSIRTYSREVREYVKRRLREIAEKTAESLRGKAVVEFPAEMAGLYNDPEIGAEMWPYAKEAVGAENCAEQPSIMASEDFAFILEKCPGVYMRVSLGDQEEGYTGIPHNAKFRINEDGMPYGVAVYCNCAYRWLRSHGE